MVESVVDRSLREIVSDPDRSLRKLVDLGNLLWPAGALKKVLFL